MAHYNPPKERTPYEGMIDDALLVLESPEVRLFVDLQKDIKYTVLNHNYQVVEINDNLVEFFGYDSDDKCIGLRFGELLNCIELQTADDGCGTSKKCKCCDGALALHKAYEDKISVNEKCTVEYISEFGIDKVNLEIEVYPFNVDNERFLALILNTETK